jgi:hypothetical protein
MNGCVIGIRRNLGLLKADHRLNAPGKSSNEGAYFTNSQVDILTISNSKYYEN